MNIRNKIKLLKAIEEDNRKAFKVLVVVKDREYKDVDYCSKKRVCVEYAFDHSVGEIVNKLQENDFYVDLVWERNSNIEYVEGYDKTTGVYTLPIELKDCKANLGEMHLNGIYNIFVRDMIESDINEIVEQEAIYFTKDTDGTRKKYLDILENKDFICKVLVNELGEVVGYIRYKYTSNEYLSNKYPSVSTTIINVKGSILYLSTLVVKREYSELGIGSAIVNMLLDEAEEKKSDYFIAFAVKDGVTEHINSKRLFEDLRFKSIGEVSDAWNQSESKINFCPTCSKNSFKVCKCSAIVYVKKMNLQ